MKTDIRILEVEPYFSLEPCRTPLKFGGVVMAETIYCHVRVKVENRQGETAEGWGAIFLANGWAWPSKIVSPQKTEQAMKEFVLRWCKLLEQDSEYQHPVDLFWKIEPEIKTILDSIQNDLQLEEPIPRMAALVSASPADAAIHDAFGNVNQIDTYLGYGKEHFEHDLSKYLGRDYQNKYISDYIQPMPEWVDAFHLVGGLDKLTESEISNDDPQDDLPVSLDQWIRFEKLHCLKIKLRGNDFDWDLERTLDIAKVAREEHQKLGINELWLTADTNEMCDTPEYLVEMLLKLKERDQQTFDSLLYLEQPCERDLARRKLNVEKLAEIKPVIVDEALGSLEDFELAIELGYSGIALKSCKCQSEQLIMAAKASQLGLPYAVQDLACPGIALLHSVGLAGHLNTIKGVESNSRQFYPTVSEPEKKVHPGVYRLTNGKIDTKTITGTGLGYQWDQIHRNIK